MINKFVETTYSLIKQTDPVKDPTDWLTRPDNEIVFKKPKKVIEKRHRVAKKRAMK